MAGETEDVNIQRVNNAMVEVQLQVAAIEERSAEYGKATYESARRVDEWAKQIIEQDVEYATLFINAINELNESRATEQEMEKMLLQTVEENVKEEESFAEEAVELESVVKELQRSKDALPAQEKLEKSALAKDRARCRAKDDQLNKLAVSVDRKVDAITAELNQYQDALGLKLDVVEDRCLQFSFICIDPYEHDAKYSVTVSIENHQFQLIDSDPMLERYDEFTRMLDSGQKLPQFVRDVRREFQKMAMKKYEDTDRELATARRVAHD